MKYKNNKRIDKFNLCINLHACSTDIALNVQTFTICKHRLKQESCLSFELGETITRYRPTRDLKLRIKNLGTESKLRIWAPIL